jgi:hypothetical protein
MSSDIVSNLRSDPYFYDTTFTICASCGQVASRKCTLIENNRNLENFYNHLRKSKGAPYHFVRWGIYVIFMVLGAVLTPIVFAGGKGQIPQPWNSLMGVLFGWVLAMLVGKYIRLALCRSGLI